MSRTSKLLDRVAFESIEAMKLVTGSLSRGAGYTRMGFRPTRRARNGHSVLGTSAGRPFWPANEMENDYQGMLANARVEKRTAQMLMIWSAGNKLLHSRDGAAFRAERILLFPERSYWAKSSFIENNNTSARLLASGSVFKMVHYFCQY